MSSRELSFAAALKLSMALVFSFLALYMVRWLRASLGASFGGATPGAERLVKQAHSAVNLGYGAVVQRHLAVKVDRIFNSSGGKAKIASSQRKHAKRVPRRMP
jgi:hypothetical protein